MLHCCYILLHFYIISYYWVLKIGFCCYKVATLSALITLINLSGNIRRGKSNKPVDNYYQYVYKITFYDESGKRPKHSDAMLFLTLTEPFRNVFEFTKYSTHQPEQKTMVSYFVERFLLGRAKLAEICFMK